MADCDGDGVGLVEPFELWRSEHHAHHRPDLNLVCCAIADDRLAHRRRSILGWGELRMGEREQRHAARMAQLERRVGILLKEDGLDRSLVRLVLLARVRPVVL